MNTKTWFAVRRRAGATVVGATVVALVLGWSCIAPAHALLGPLPPLPGALIVKITAPASGATVSATTTVSARVSIVGAVTVSQVQFQLDGVDLGRADTQAPYSIPWDTTTTANGSHTLTAVAQDGLGVEFTSAPVKVTVANAPPKDTTPPTATVTSPASGATVAGTISVTANASDNVGVTGVQFFVDGATLGAEDTAAPYSVSWNTNTATNGVHTLTARARDAAGNAGFSAQVAVSVSNAPPPDTTPPTVRITAPASGATVAGAITVDAVADDNVGVAGVQFFVDGSALGAEDTAAPYAVPWDTTTTANGSHTLTARARDVAGNVTTSAAVTVSVANGPPPDTTPPTVSITAPASGATVAGTISVTANASDNVGVAGVQFFVDGVALGAEDTAAPYATAWDTSTSNDGSHTLTARARDAAGNATTSAAVTMTVANGTPQSPTVTRTEDTDPAVTYTGTWVHGDMTFAWSGGSASYSRGPAARASFTFTGTRVSWIGWRESRGGIARVFLDGVQVAQVDLFSATPAIQEPVFTSGVLTDGTHTLEVEATGTANPSATDTIVVVDAFEVTSSSASPPPPPPPPPATGTTTRHEETDPAIVYSPGAWLTESTMAWSGGSAQYSASVDAEATFTFSGTGVSWIGYRGHFGGIVNVFLDGAAVATIDTYSPTEQVSVPVYTAADLAPGSHSVRIHLTGTKNAAADASETAVDAFDVTQ